MSSAACCASSTWGSRRSTPRRTWTCWLTVRRSEEHTSELQSRSDLVCRLLLEKKKKKDISNAETTEKRPYKRRCELERGLRRGAGVFRVSHAQRSSDTAQATPERGGRRKLARR